MYDKEFSRNNPYVLCLRIWSSESSISLTLYSLKRLNGIRDSQTITWNDLYLKDLVAKFSVQIFNFYKHFDRNYLVKLVSS